MTGATATLAYQLNATNQSCGYYVDADGVTTHGYWRDSDGTINAPIDPVGSTSTILFGNNNMNLMVGRYSDAAGATHGILFLPSNNSFVVYDFRARRLLPSMESTNAARSSVAMLIAAAPPTVFSSRWCAAALV